MSLFVYVSHRDPVDALVSARQLIEGGHFPFVPQLNKLIPGRKDEDWENYYKMWLFRCDCILLTPSFREHEMQWAAENKVPIAHGTFMVNDIKLPPFGELGRKFGEAVASQLESNEGWRQAPKEDIVKGFQTECGLGAQPLYVGLLALKAWDRTVNG